MAATGGIGCRNSISIVKSIALPHPSHRKKKSVSIPVSRKHPFHLHLARSSKWKGNIRFPTETRGYPVFWDNCCRKILTPGI
jgi:hypothetical protein